MAKPQYRLVPNTPNDGDEGRMGFLEHLDELRQRLIRACLALGVGMLVAFFFVDRIADFVLAPTLKVLPPGTDLIATRPGETFSFYLNVALIGGVVLAVTGAEALYADLGHFGRRPIRLAWFVVVMPALLLNYFGQGALILRNPAAIENPFYKLYPGWALIPMVALATIATVIASQAVITGAYSVTQQAVQLGLLPRMEIQYTSDVHAGQIYLPDTNWLLLFGVLLLVFTFGTSGALASAYGIAVTGTMVVTTALAFLVIWKAWRWPAAPSARRPGWDSSRPARATFRF